MYCPKCGAQNEDNAYKCVKCGEVLQSAVPPPGPLGQPYASAQKLPNYLVQAILVTLFCCLPFGIVSIVYAAQVNGKLQAGDYAGAKNASDKAKLWCWVSFGVGLLAIIAYGALMALGFVAGVRH